MEHAQRVILIAAFVTIMLAVLILVLVEYAQKSANNVLNNLKSLVS